MGRSRLEDADILSVAEELGVPVTEVRRAVNSFFGEIVSESRALPFDNGRRIYSKELFERRVKVWNIPSIGRMGPVYSRYLKWRGNEARASEQEPRRNYRSRVTRDDIERVAGDILSGRTPSPLRRRKGSELYDNVWLVGQDGRRLARQVIPKKKKDV